MYLASYMSSYLRLISNAPTRPLSRAYGGCAGLLGIGGGMIVSPLLLELGLHPQVAAATSSLMVLFSASSAALSFAFDHLLNIEYALIYGIGTLLPRTAFGDQG